MTSALAALARSYGVALSYEDGFHNARKPSPEALAAILRALGAQLDDVSDARDALDARRAEEAARLCDPIVVAWDGAGAELAVQTTHGGTFDVDIQLENGTMRTERIEPIPSTGSRAIVKLPRLEFGYHSCTVHIGSSEVHAWVISAPKKAPSLGRERTWGIFAPTYAVTSSRSWGAGDLTDLHRVARATEALGGRFVGTLPLLASFPDEASPYSPVSRLFWNESYLDVDAVREVVAEPGVVGDDLRRTIAELNASPLVDHARVAAVKRSVLESCVRSLIRNGGPRLRTFESFVRKQPELARYAAFRAETERSGRPWWEWRTDAHAGEDRSDPAWSYHAYAQWQMHEQLEQRARDARLYLDLPLGVRPDGFDTWRFGDAFARGLDVGAPPDAFFSRGQKWGFAPLHPERIRSTAYAYQAASIRTIARYASALRIDHVMGFHRVFVTPSGADAADGTYLRFQAEELYAVLTLEAHRAGTIVVGEDLGTVPPAVRPAMTRHALHRTYILQEELRANIDDPIQPAPRSALAALNTHDMPTFASFWSGRDIDERRRDGLLDDEQAEQETKRRAAKRDALIALLRESGTLHGDAEADAAGVAAAALAYLSVSRATLVMVSLEDLWGETEPQNRPGTGSEASNWRRKTAYTLEALFSLPSVITTLRAIDERRSRGRRSDR